MTPMKIAIIVGKMDSGGKKNLIMEYYRHIDRDKIQFDFILCLIGDGELKEEMVKKIDELGIKKQVAYLGRREDIQQFYNAMDCFLLPSLYEGLPVVGLEAESCGLPMFFSTEVTREANACELGHFVGLDESIDVWAEKIIKACKENMPIRRSHAKEVCDAGFDSASEAIRLQNYYFKALEKEKGQYNGK